jgi:hypothetical protein
VIEIAARISDKDRLERYKVLDLTPQEAQDLLVYDKQVENNERTEFDLSPEKQKIAQKFAHTGTRKKPITFDRKPRQRKPNATKGGIIAELAQFLEHNSQFSIVDLKVLNSEKLISFKVGENTYELDLKQKRKTK